MRITQRHCWTCAKWTLRVIGLLALLALIGAAVFIWQVQQPKGTAWLSRYINERVPGEVRFESVRVSLLEGVSLATVRYIHKLDDHLLLAEMDSLNIIDFFFGVPRARIRNGTVSLDQETFSAARSIAISLPDQRGRRPLRISIENGWLDPRPIQTIVSATPTEAEPEPLDAPSIRLELSQINVRGLATIEHLFWQGVIQIEAAFERLEYDLQLVPEDGASRGREGRISLKGALSPSPMSLENSFIRAEMFPLRLDDPLAIQSRLDGRLDLIAEVDSGYTIDSNMVMRPLVVGIPQAATVSSVSAAIRTTVHLNRDFGITSAHLDVDHAPLSVVDNEQELWLPPAGTFLAIADNLTSASPAINASWKLDRLGLATIRVADWPINASSTFTLDMETLDSNLRDWLQALSPSYQTLLEDIEGVVSATGTLNWLDSNSQSLEVVGAIDQVRYRVGAATIDSASVDAIVRVDTDFKDNESEIAIDIEANHAPLTIIDSASEVWSPPAGTLAATSENLLATAPIIVAEWRSERLGSARIRAATWPLDASSPFSLTINLRETPLDVLLAMTPSSYEKALMGLDGRLSANGTIHWSDSTVRRHEIDARLGQPSYVISPVEISGSDIVASMKGDLNRMDIALAGALGVEWSPGEAQPFVLDFSELTANAIYRPPDGDFSIQFDPADAGAYRNITAQWRSDGRWSVNGDMTLDDGIGDLFATLLPWLERSVEGMGDAEVSFEGDGASFLLDLTSPDLTLFSFDREPGVGAQLRDAAFRIEMNSQPDGHRASGFLTAATPYIAFEGDDYEWPDSLLRIDFNVPNPDWGVIEFSAYPPGEGEIEGRYEAGTKWLAAFTNLDMEEFVLPILKRFALGYPEGARPSWTASGKLHGSIEAALSAEESQYSGLISLSDFDFFYRGEPKLNALGATVSIPFSYPARFDALPSRMIDFKAASALVDQTTFENPAFQIPITREAIAYHAPWRLPLYGGSLDIEGLSILEWESPAPALAGRFVVNDLDLAKVSALVPMLPPRGSLSGELDLTEASIEEVNASGELLANVFGGEMRFTHFTLSNPLSEDRYLELDIDFERLDLTPLVAYFNFGKMTGRVSGYIHQLRLRLPRPGSNQLARPTRFDARVYSLDRQTKMISRETLETIYNLGEQTGITRIMIDREHYLYGQLGLRARLQGDQMRLYGDLADNLFLATPQTAGIGQLFRPSDWFAIPVNIKLASPDDIIPFEHVWERLIEESRSP